MEKTKGELSLKKAVQQFYLVNVRIVLPRRYQEGGAGEADGGDQILKAHTSESDVDLITISIGMFKDMGTLKDQDRDWEIIREVQAIKHSMRKQTLKQAKDRESKFLGVVVN